MEIEEYFNFKDILNFLNTKGIMAHEIVFNKLKFEVQYQKFIIVSNCWENEYRKWEEYTIYFAGEITGPLSLNSTIKFLELIIDEIKDDKIVAKLGKMENKNG